MVRSTVKKVMWVGRATVFMVGLAVILALVLGAATAALGKTGGNFILGRSNTAETPTSLVSTLADATKSAMIVNNKSGGSALDLRVGNATTPANDVAPMRVNSSKVVTNLNADTLDGQEASAFLGADAKAADSDKLDNLDSTAFGIKTEHNIAQSSECDAPGVNNDCAPVRVVVPPGKSYHVSIWSSMSWTGASAPQDIDYCSSRIAVGGGAQGSHCVTPFSNVNRITLPAGQRVAASASGETTLGPGTWDLATTVTPVQSQVGDSDRNWIITKVMVRDASAPAPQTQ